MERIAHLEAEAECHALVVAYSHLIDLGRAAEVADLFTADGVWESADTRMDGQDAIRAGFTRRQAMTERRSRHVCTNFAFELLDETTARGTVYFTLYREDGATEHRPATFSGPAMVGDYYDEFRRVRGHWLIASRVAKAAFIAAD